MIMKRKRKARKCCSTPEASDRHSGMTCECAKVCAVVNQVQIINATNITTPPCLHTHHCSNGNGDHHGDWHQHAHGHGRQPLGVLTDVDIARCFENGNEVVEHQATTRTKASLSAKRCG